MRSYVSAVGHQTLLVAHQNVWWMSWNLLLAAVPVLLAVALFHRQHRRTVLWWAGVAVFVLFLPNAPYVLTDLIHLRSDLRSATLDGTVLFGILPLYALFVLAGYSCYAVALHEVSRAIARSRWSARRRLALLGLHAACAVGVLLGRVPHINSWLILTEPGVAVSASTRTLTDPAAPLAILGLFAAIWLGHDSTRLVAQAAYRSWSHRLDRRGRRQGPPPLGTQAL